MRYGYDALNRIRHIRYGNGVETAYTYDGDGNIRTLETRAGENVLLSFAYRYDGNGNRTAKTGMQAGVTLGGVTSEITAGNNALDISYNYDVRGQLLEERRNGASVCYAYDKAGNRIRKTDAQGETRYLYNEKLLLPRAPETILFPAENLKENSMRCPRHPSSISSCSWLPVLINISRSLPASVMRMPEQTDLPESSISWISR